MYGAIFSDYDIRDYQLICSSEIEDFPQEFELELRGIKNQGAVGSCVAHALASVIEYYNYHQAQNDEIMSVGYIYGNRTSSQHKGKGMVVRDALADICKSGDVKHSLFPYNKEVPEIIDLFEMEKDTLFQEGYPNRVSQYCRVYDTNSIKTALMSGKPVVFAITWYRDMKVVNGILTTEYKSPSGGHCMIIYGWNEQGWKVQNSWGENWGNHGCMIMPYSIKIIESWVITDDVVEKVIIKKPWLNSKIIAKLINFIVNLFKIKR